MDLTEIRKKARSRTGPSSSRLEPENKRSTAAIQGTPPEPAGKPDAPPAGAGRSVPGGADPLEALFARRQEFGLASEELYLQRMTDSGKEEAGDQRQWLTFGLADEEYALDIGQIREIIKPREITDIPRVPEFILGIISLRGIVVPVFDLRFRLQLGRAELTENSRIIVCHEGDRSGGLLVDRISQVVRLPAERIEPPPAILTGLDRDLVLGIGRRQGRMMTLLNLANVLNAELV